MTRSNILTLIPDDSRVIIYACLNWGLGHASRSIPIIQTFIDSGKEVIIASDGEALALLQEQFPQIETVECASYKVKYKSKGLIKLIVFNTINVFKAIVLENRQAKNLVSRFQPDVIISDSRFGFRHKQTHSVIISHQLNLNVWGGMIAGLVNWVNQRLLNKFDQVWIPDNENSTLSGKLSINPDIRRKTFIGIQSRLEKKTQSQKFDIAILLSGPENARTELETKLIQVFSLSAKNIILVRGTKLKPPINLKPNWTIVDRANASQMNEIILSSNKIIGRAGYSSILDYYHLEKGAYLIPTPGQAEQEYLAKHLNDQFNFIHINEKDLQTLEVLA